MRTSIIQLTTLLLLAVAANAQPNPLAYVQTRVDQDQSATFQEKIFAHTDKTFYLAGEILWLKLYCLDATTHRPLDLSKLAYVEVLGPDNRPALQGKIALDKGRGEGSFSLPPSIHTGNYRLRAYTNWMKNDGPRNFFEQPITIVNVFGGLPAGADSTDTLTHQPIPKPEPFHLALFPEGGDLVTGLHSTIAFEATDDQDRTLNATGYIADDHNDTILSFHTLHDGMGTLTFTPAKGKTYHALMPCPDGVTRSWPLPTPKDQGCVLHLRDPDAHTLTFTVQTSQGRSPQNLRLFIRGSAHAAFSTQLPQTTGDSATFTVSRDSLTEGINRFTIFDEGGHPLAERAFFLPPHHRLLLTATSDQASYTTRHKVQLSIASRSEDGNNLSSDLSLSVYRLDSLQGYPATDIYNFLWLSSDWQERTGRTPLTGDQPDTSSFDLLMLTHGWTRFRWTDILHPNGETPAFTPELRGQFITGHLTEPHTGAPGKGIITWFTAPGSVFQFASSITDSNGRFQFDIKDFYGSEGVVIHTPADQPIRYKIDLANPFSEQYDPTPLPPFRLPIRPNEKDAQLLIQHSIGMQVQNVYAGDSLSRYRRPQVDSTPFYGKPDYTYRLDDYTRFTSMEEVLREYVREINVGRERGHLHVIMLNEPAHATFDDGKTLVLLDGIPVPTDSIFNYDPQKVKRLDVIPREYILGPSRFSGIASYTTYKGDYEGLELDANSLLIDYDGLQWHREFYSPAYNTDKQTQSRIPDFRNLLYWNPAVRTGNAAANTVQFYTSDLPGNYLVVVQGISPDGRAGITYQHFTVTK
jgi:hypothetical protein